MTHRSHVGIHISNEQSNYGVIAETLLSTIKCKLGVSDKVLYSDAGTSSYINLPYGCLTQTQEQDILKGT